MRTVAPPSSSAVASSFVTVFTTSGPVTNLSDASRTMKMKSVMAGEYASPPAHGPIMTAICGITPLLDRAYAGTPTAIARQRRDAFLMRAPPASKAR